MFTVSVVGCFLAVSTGLGFVSHAQAGLVCDPNLCYNRSYAAARGVGNYTPYDDCMAEAGAVRAFQCRCTRRMYYCLVNRSFGNCSDRAAKQACRHSVLTDARFCSPDLCQAAGTSPLSFLPIRFALARVLPLAYVFV